MPFPSVPGKYEHPATYPASRFLDALRTGGWEPGPVPSSVVYTYARLELYLSTRPDLYTPNHMLGVGPNRFFLVNESDGAVGINCLGIGAPAAVAQMELQAELGVRRFASIGTAGGLVAAMDPGDTVVVTGAVRDEGTSYHYLPPDAEAVPDPDLTDAFRTGLVAAGIPFAEGTTLTTDAPHRTTASEVIHHRAGGVLTVEMEAAALFAAASALGVRCASAVVVDGVADDDGAAWRLDLRRASDALQRLLAVTVELLSSVA